MRVNRFRAVATVAAVGALVLAAGAVTSPASAAPTPPAYTCTGGDFTTDPPTFSHVPSGTFSSVTIAGVCDVLPGALINIVGNLGVAAGAFFDAQSSASTISVGHNVTADTGSLMGLGCQPGSFTGNSGHECSVTPEDHSVITIHGNVTATDANTILLNGIWVGGNVTLTGGGGEIPWAEKNNTVGRNFTVSGVSAEWFGALWNHVARNMTLTDITALDPEDPTPTPRVAFNVIGNNLTCTGIGPYIGGQKNVVGHNALGQCAALV